MKNTPYYSFPSFDSYRDIFYEALHKLNKEGNLGLSEKTIQKNLTFIEICYNYRGSIRGLNHYLKNKGYALHYNMGESKTFGIEFRKEIESFKSGILLVGYYFNESNKIERYLMGGKMSKAKSIQKQFSKLFDFIINPLPNGI